MRNALDELLSQTVTLVNAINHEPAPGSIAESELDCHLRKTSIKTAQDQSYLVLESAADYMSGLVKTLSEPVETVAPWSLSRGVMECSAISIWLGRPDISSQERVCRSLAFRLNGLHEQNRLKKNVPEAVGPLEESYKKLLETANEVGVEIKLNSKGIPTKIGTHFPSSTDLCVSELGESSIYRILSAMTHSQPFAIQQLSLRHLRPSDNDPDRVDNEKFLSNESVAFMCSFAGRSFLRAFSARLKYFGYLKEEIIRTLRKSADKLPLNEEDFRYCIWAKE